MKQLALLIPLLAASSLAQEITVSRDTIWVDAVKRGPMVRAVRGLGTVANRTTVELNVPAPQAVGVRSGQPAEVDTKAERLQGRVTRVDPVATNGVAKVLIGLAQPTGAAPGANVDGTIEIERLENVLFIGRPTSGGPESEASLFKVDADGAHASKVRVRFGRASLNTLQLLSGLQAGDRVILSDTKAFDQHDRITLK